MDLHLAGKTALVTGGAKGIGAATAQSLAREGAAVILAGRSPAEGEALARDIEAAHGRAIFVEADLAREADCQRVVHAAMETFGRVDILIHNAGRNDGIGLDQPPDRFLASLKENLSHVYTLTHLLREELCRRRGAIVMVGSKVAVTGQGSTSGYAAAKGALNALTREWALSLAPEGVRVNAVLPAECITPQYQAWFDTLPDPAGARRAIESLVPLGRRMTTAEEVADMIVFLASPRSGHTTGQIIFVDGGYTHLDRAATHDHTKWG